MKLIYHGTPLRKALFIAEDGLIKSPWEKAIDDIGGVYGKSQRARRIIDSRGGIEAYALNFASSEYSDREIEYRVKCISMTNYFSLASAYGGNNETRDGGVVLALAVDETLRKVLPQDWEKKGTIFVPRKISIDTLAEVHVSPKAIMQMEKIQEAFAKYDPKFIPISS